MKYDLPQTSTYITKYNRYQTLYLNSSKTPAEVIEFDALQLELMDYMITSNDWNNHLADKAATPISATPTLTELGHVIIGSNINVDTYGRISVPNGSTSLSGVLQLQNSIDSNVTKAVTPGAVLGNIASTPVTIAGVNNTTFVSPYGLKSILDYKGIDTGWNTLNTTATYNSVDTAIGIINTSTSLKGLVNEGMRFKFDQAQALTAYWDFNIGSTAQVGTYTVTNQNVTFSAGKFSNAATFNGTNARLQITDVATLKPTGAFTVGCWFKTNNTGAIKGLFQSFSYASSIPAGIKLSINSSNTLTSEIGNNSGINISSILNGTTIVTDNVYHYVVLSYQNNYMQLYLDGKLEASIYSLNPVYNSTNYIRIGCFTNTGTDANFMNGQIDDFFFINGYSLDEISIREQYELQTAQGINDISVTKCGLISFVESDKITIYTGTDYALANSAITNIYFSDRKWPYNFPSNPDKWSTSMVLQAGTQTTPVISTTYNLGSNVLQLPIGSWDFSYGIVARIDNGGTSTDKVLFGFISDSSNSLVNSLQILRNGVVGSYYLDGSVSGITSYVVKSKTSKYLVFQAAAIAATGSAIALYAGGFLKAKSTYL